MVLGVKFQPLMTFSTPLALAAVSIARPSLAARASPFFAFQPGPGIWAEESDAVRQGRRSKSENREKVWN